LKSKGVFFDRDGTLIKSLIENNKLRAISKISDLELLPQARKTMVELKQRGYKLIIVTNQPDIISGLTSKIFLKHVNDFLENHLELDLVKVAFGNKEEDPQKYKPGPGMLIEAASELNIDLENSYMVGDRWRDIGAGKNAGCKTILIETQSIEDVKFEPDFRVRNLIDLLDIIK
jgi:D-glycero-D-manno-heptose 1,7-bisphosphate phosphatase